MIEAMDIRKSFGDVEVLRDISLQIPDAQVTAIVGPSGAGKSTLLQVLGTLELPDTGRVLYGSEDVTRFGDHRLSQFRNSNIGFVFQNHRLLPEFSLVENVMIPAMIGGASAQKARGRAMELLTMLGLADRAAHKPAAVSGGEAQRAAVARALVNEPQVVLADEPSGSLDSRNRSELHHLFFELCRRLGTTFVIVTHDETLAADAHRIIRMADGRIV